MITAISKVKETNSKANYTNQNKNNSVQKQSHSDNPNIIGNLNQVSFKGNLTKVGKNLLEEKGSRFGKKITKVAEEIFDSLKTSTRRLTSSENEIPYSQKPLILKSVDEDKAKETAKIVKKINDARGVNAPHLDGKSEVDIKWAKKDLKN